MVKFVGWLTAELMEQVAQYTDGLRDRSWAFKYKAPVIENLGAALDQFDAIDFSDNEIRKLDGFPLLRRLKTLLVSNNRLCRIGEGLDQVLPCLNRTHSHPQQSCGTYSKKSLLDFQKLKLKEHQEAKKMFKGTWGTACKGYWQKQNLYSRCWFVN
uniref:U2A'/phosphoprotein 32 family A C-terminal domain-containing protein n=1 Tax=Oryctolagus cuniculus TaxID=9986 RepID=A0A5F9D1K5_RABIT